MPSTCETELRASRSQGTAHTTAAKSAEGEAAEAGGEGEMQPAPIESPIEWLKINARHHAAQILQSVKLRAFNPRAVEWQRMHAVAAVFHHQYGHLAIPATEKLDDYAVGAWMRRQRRWRSVGRSGSGFA
ncbi:helicase associated domain-containing protein [Kitasatospora sp. NPDC001683]